MKAILRTTARFLKTLPFIRTFVPFVRLFPHFYAATMDQHVRDLLGLEKYSDPRKLNRYEFSAYSQCGEDGIIAEIFSRIGDPSKTFLEIGTGSGLENNTVFLLLQGWSGHWIEGSKRSVRQARATFRRPIAEKRLSLRQAFVTAENIEGMLNELGVPHEIDLLSLDIDRNTYEVWKSIRNYRPRAVVIEYNAHFPATMDWKSTYRSDLTWNGSIDYGASLKAYEKLGRDIGYCLVGCNLAGTNVFFVRDDLCNERVFMDPFTAENHYEPFRHYLTEGRGGFPRSFPTM